ncbi:hypothetical protein OC845_001264 [Tilletia horrida]|nr:hypothetical protein OC845_001264 [Tilletia horrida]
MSVSYHPDGLNLLGLPVELQTSIFLHCGYFDLFALRATCRAFRIIIEEPCFDRALFRPNVEDTSVAIQHIECDLVHPPEQGNPFLTNLEVVRLHPVVESAIWSFQPGDASVFCGPVELIMSDPPCYLDAKDKTTTVLSENATDPPVAEATVALRIGCGFVTHYHYHRHDRALNVGDVYEAFGAALNSVASVGVALFLPDPGLTFQHDWNSPPSAGVLEGRIVLYAELSY